MSAHRVGPLLQGEFHNWIRVYRAKLEFMPSSVQKNGEGNGHPLQYAFPENPTDRGAWQVTVRGVTRVGHDLATKPAPKRVRGLASEWEVSVKTARCSVPHHGDRALRVRGQDHASSAAASDPACLCHLGGQPCRGRIVFLTQLSIKCAVGLAWGYSSSSKQRLYVSRSLSRIQFKGTFCLAYTFFKKN